MTGSGLFRAGVPTDLDPAGDEARRWLSDELAKSEYHDTRSLFQRFMDWLGQRIEDLQGTQGTGGTSLPPVVITVLVVVAVAVVVYLLTKVRVERKIKAERTSLLGDNTQTVEDLRRAAEQALQEERFTDAVLAWTRAIARDAERRTLLPNATSMTAHEVGTTLAVAFPDHVPAIGATMDLFDAVAYGKRDASRDDALLSRSTDEALRSARPTLPERPRRPRDEDRDEPPEDAPSARQAPSATDRTSVWMTGVGS